MLAFALGLAATTSGFIAPNGRRLHPVDQCFVIERGGKPIGVTRQIVTSATTNGRPVWEVVVHQKVDAMHFDMRDHFLLARTDLRPIAFDSRKNGVEHVRLSYGDAHVTGHRNEGEGAVPIDTALTGPTWEGNLWGVTFGALPLKEGRTLTLPFYQYDHGLGQFTLRTTGQETVRTPTGALSAWVVEAGTNGTLEVTYLIDKQTGEELGTRAPQFDTRLGGDCSTLD